MSHSTLEQDAANPWHARVVEVARVVLERARSTEPTLGTTRLICVDGPAGSGKSTLGRAVHAAASALGSAHLIHLDDLLEGWSGLARVSETLDRDVLVPLRDGRPGLYHRYDWGLGRFAEAHVVPPVDFLVVDGVGSGASAYSSSITTLVWVEAPRNLRLARGIARDGEEVLPQWQQWLADEDALFRRERTWERADVIVDGTGDGEQPAVLA